MKCKRCDSTNTHHVENMECEDTMTNLPVVRNVIQCIDCNCIHYKENGSSFFEFEVNKITSSTVYYVSDQELARKKLETQNA